MLPHILLADDDEHLRLSKANATLPKNLKFIIWSGGLVKVILKTPVCFETHDSEETHDSKETQDLKETQDSKETLLPKRFMIRMRLKT